MSEYTELAFEIGSLYCDTFCFAIETEALLTALERAERLDPVLIARGYNRYSDAGHEIDEMSEIISDVFSGYEFDEIAGD
jgi:hypothetical protein